MEPTSAVVSIILTTIFLASYALVLAPTWVDDSKPYVLFALRASAIIACFLRLGRPCPPHLAQPALSSS